MTGDRKLVKLALANLGLGIVAALLAPIRVSGTFRLDFILVVPLFASVLCQAVLLALWGASSKASLWGRMAGLVAGAVYLEALFPFDLRRECLGISTITIAVTTAICFVGRALGVRLALRNDLGQPTRAETEGLRFSIRGLMLFTAAVALLSAGARALQDSLNGMILRTAVWAMCFVAVGLVAFWAALGDARPLRRGPVVLALSPVLGVFFAFAAGAQRAGWVYIILIMLLYPALLLGSLLIVRSRGYRLVRRAAPFSEPSDGGDGRSSHQTPVSGVTTGRWPGLGAILRTHDTQPRPPASLHVTARVARCQSPW
jgi:hypothetical protein